MACKGSSELRTMHSKSENMEILIGNETDEITEELFDSLLQKYQKGLEESMERSKCVFDSLDLFHYKLHIRSLNWGESYINSDKWFKNKRATINSKSNDNKCFQYAITIALNHKSIGIDLQRISKIKPLIDQYNLKEIKFPSHKKIGKFWIK